jgi:hypothetical protein
MSGEESAKRPGNPTGAPRAAKSAGVLLGSVKLFIAFDRLSKET